MINVLLFGSDRSSRSHNLRPFVRSLREQSEHYNQGHTVEYCVLLLGVAKQKKKAATVTEKDQGNYIDSSRNTAVNLDSKELSKTLKKIKNEDGEIDNTGIVNSDMYQREAQHYATKGLHVACSKNLSIGKNDFISHKLIGGL